ARQPSEGAAARHADRGHRGTGFAGPQVAPPWGGGAEGASGGGHYLPPSLASDAGLNTERDSGGVTSYCLGNSLEAMFR
ncbi:hypothetical protein H010_21496, partial [Hydrogenophaga taeniospiralis CCUG 15921]|nr:hypothetical protein [Hydrogenophaga taeniospiralis CCUG 15921]